MAYLDGNGNIQTDNQSTIDISEVGKLPDFLKYLENYAKEMEEISNATLPGESATMANVVVNTIHRIMVLTYLNLYLYRLNNFYDYDFTENRKISTLEIYKMVQTGEMASIWAPIKVKKYNKVYNIGSYTDDSEAIRDFKGGGGKFNDKVPVYKETVNNLFDYVKSIYRLGYNFYNIVGTLNKNSATGRVLNRDDLLNPNDIDKIHRLNPMIFSYVADTSAEHGYYKVDAESIVQNFYELKQRDYRSIQIQYPHDNEHNYNKRYTNEREDIMFNYLFFKPLNDDYQAMTDGFLRYATYVSLFDLTKENSFYIRKYRPFHVRHESINVSFLKDLAKFIKNYVRHAKKIIRLPTPDEETTVTVPNTIFKKVNYLEELELHGDRPDRERELLPFLYTNETGLERGKVATVESLMTYLFKNLGLKILHLARYNPAMYIGEIFGNGNHDEKKKCFIPCFGIARNGSILLDHYGNTRILNPFSVINAKEIIDGESRLMDVKQRVENGDYGEFGRYNTETSPGTFGTIDVMMVRSFNEYIERGIKIFREESSEYSSLSGLDSYLKNSEFIKKFKRKYGVEPKRNHFIPISIVELFMRYIVGTIRASIINRLRYEPLPKVFLDKLNAELGNTGNFPLGTKFLYISLYANDNFDSATTESNNHGRKLDRFVGEYINKGYSNKWGVTDPEILEVIKRLEQIDDNVVLNKESVDIMIDVMYKLIINYISAPSREDSFRDSVDRELRNANSGSYKDPDIKRHILLPLLDDMRANSDFS